MLFSYKYKIKDRLNRGNENDQDFLRQLVQHPIIQIFRRQVLSNANDHSHGRMSRIFAVQWGMFCRRNHTSAVRIDTVPSPMIHHISLNSKCHHLFVPQRFEVSLQKQVITNQTPPSITQYLMNKIFFYFFLKLPQIILMQNIQNKT